jgi:hypothetical protein
MATPLVVDYAANTIVKHTSISVIAAFLADYFI